MSAEESKDSSSSLKNSPKIMDFNPLALKKQQGVVASSFAMIDEDGELTVGKLKKFKRIWGYKKTDSTEITSAETTIETPKFITSQQKRWNQFAEELEEYKKLAAKKDHNPDELAKAEKKLLAKAMLVYGGMPEFKKREREEQKMKFQVDLEKRKKEAEESGKKFDKSLPENKFDEDKFEREFNLNVIKYFKDLRCQDIRYESEPAGLSDGTIGTKITIGLKGTHEEEKKSEAVDKKDAKISKPLLEIEVANSIKYTTESGLTIERQLPQIKKITLKQEGLSEDEIRIARAQMIHQMILFAQINGSSAYHVPYDTKAFGAIKEYNPGEDVPPYNSISEMEKITVALEDMTTMWTMMSNRGIKDPMLPEDFTKQMELFNKGLEAKIKDIEEKIEKIEAIKNAKDANAKFSAKQSDEDKSQDGIENSQEDKDVATAENKKQACERLEKALLYEQKKLKELKPKLELYNKTKSESIKEKQAEIKEKKDKNKPKPDKPK